MRCDECQNAMLDELYGLLEPAESSSLAAHIESCPACAAMMVKAKAEQDLLQKASTLTFPALTFTPPADTSPIVPSTYVEPLGKSVRQTWIGWVIAASVLLAAAGTFGPVVRTATSNLTTVKELSQAKSAVETANLQYQDAKAKYDLALNTSAQKVAEAKKAHDQVVSEWVNAENVAIRSKPFVVTVRGPAAAIPGAPNDYAVDAMIDDDKKITAKIDATLKGHGGKEYFKAHAETVNGRGVNLRVPASVWVNVPADETLTLNIVATNDQGQVSELAEPVRVLAPIYSTMLSTDAPLYRPGDTIRVRSLTLDRTRFLPPERDLILCYALLDSRGNIVNATGNQPRISKMLSLAGTTRLESFENDERISRLMSGPDGKPIKGIGCGELKLPAQLPGGNYKLAVYELPSGWTDTKPSPGAVPLATRPLLIQTYSPHKWNKSLTFDARTYGPGEVVTAKLNVTEQGQPVSKAVMTVQATVDGQPIITIDQPPTLDQNGQATIHLTLPSKGELKQATLTVGFIQGNQTNETIIRPIPLVTRTMAVEFFPEGGDLIAGVPNRVYVRGRLPDGKPADFAGMISDGTNDVASVRSETDPQNPGANQGTGVFTFTPIAGTNYTLNLNRPLGLLTKSAKLPAVKKDGVALTVPRGVFNDSETIPLTVISTQPRKLIVGAYTRGTPVAHVAVSVESGVAAQVVLKPDASAPGGVTRVTVFEEPDQNSPGRKELKPVAERLIFRTSSKRLDLSVQIQSNEVHEDEAPGGSALKNPIFLPGQQIQFDIKAKNELGQPTAAVLYAAITNESLYSMADDTTERSLPTHFLLNGEVQNPDALERADFLLSDHPLAANSLDRLLGTQGWRRFAEQNPAEFRKTAKPDDADRLLLAVGSKAPVSTEYKPAVQRVIQTYRPKYEAELSKLELAEAEQARNIYSSEEANRVIATAHAYQPEAVKLNALIKDYQLDNGDENEQFLGGITLMIIGVFACVLFLLRFTVLRNTPERGVVLMGAVALCALIGTLTFVKTVLSPRSEQVRAVKSDLWEPKAPQTPRTTTSVQNAPAMAMRGQEGMNSPTIRFTPGVNAIDNGQPIILQADRWNEASAGSTSDVASERDRNERLAKLKGRFENHTDATDRIANLVASQPACVVREYGHQRPQNSEFRADFTDMVFWNPVIVLPGEGLPQSLHFQLSDAITSYRVTVAGHTLDGRLGQTTARIRVNKSLAAEVKIPREVGMGDRIDAIASVKATGIQANPKLYLRATNATAETSEWLEKQKLPLDEFGAAQRTFRITPKTPGEASVQVWAIDDSTRLRDIIERPIHITPEGYPVSGIQSTMVDVSANFPISISPKRIPQSLAIKVTAFPNPLAELESGIVGIAKGPAGCFEQTTAQSYPNVLFLQWFEDHAKENLPFNSTAANARDALPGTYRKLLNFECEKPGRSGREGFEWFGGSATPHESLTAYGLMHFSDFKKIYPVEQNVLDRTKQFLMSRRDGNGGFRQSTDAKDAFGRAPANVANAYITWALTEVDRSLDLKMEREAVSREAQTSNDSYRLALAALAQGDATNLVKQLAMHQSPDGSVAGAETSITNSAGPDLLTETTALAVQAWSRAGKDFESNLQKGIAYLMSRRQPGGTFGATQATVLSLKAIVEANRTMPKAKPQSLIRIISNEKEVGSFALNRSNSYTFNNIDEWFAGGKSDLRIESTAGVTMPVSVEWSYRSNDFSLTSNPNLTFSTSLSQTDVVEGSAVQLKVNLANPSKRDHGMVVATIGIPAGLVVPTDGKQLTEITNRAKNGDLAPAYWEQRGRELVLYWRGLPALKESAINIELIAEFPGEYRSSFSEAYPFYDTSVRSQRLPLKVKISPTK